MPCGIICGRITPARGNLEHRPLSGAVSQLVAKHQDLEKHASAHARSMAVTLERIEDTEQNIKMVRKKICNNEEEISKMSKENNDILYPREKDLVSTYVSSTITLVSFNGKIFGSVSFSNPYIPE